MNQKMNYVLLFLVSAFSTLSSLIAQNETQIIAQIGGKNITLNEFVNRFEFMPHLNYSAQNFDTLKKEFLYSLIAEKLWAINAEELKYDEFDEIKYSLKTLEKLFIKDELYKKEVVSNLSLSNSEINFGLLNVSRILNAAIISSTDSMEIYNVYNLLRNGFDLDSLQSIKNSNQVKLSSLKIKLGDFQDEYLEHKIFELKNGEITQPTKSNNIWLIFKIITEEIDSTIIQGTEQAKNKVISLLKNRKENKLADSIFNKIFVGREVSADKKLFEMLCETINNILLKQNTNVDINTLNDIQLTEAHIVKIIKLLTNEQLTQPFIEIDSVHVTLKDFLYYLIYQKIFLKSLNLNDIKLTINPIIKQFIENEILYREGIKRGLNKVNSIHDDIQLWKDYYLSESLMQSYSDSITVNNFEIDSYLRKKNNYSDSIEQVDIIEILVSNLSDAETVLNEINNDKTFEKLAEEFNERESTKKSNGRLGFFPINSGGEIGKIASELNIGEIYGPLKVPEGFSIFKLVDKRRINQFDINSESVDTSLIRLQIALGKMDKLITEKTIEFAKKNEININEDLLNKVELSVLNTFTYRLIGFGGKIAAFPITVPLYDWAKFNKIKNKLP